MVSNVRFFHSPVRERLVEKGFGLDYTLGACDDLAMEGRETALLAAPRSPAKVGGGRDSRAPTTPPPGEGTLPLASSSDYRLALFPSPRPRRRPNLGPRLTAEFCFREFPEYRDWEQNEEPLRSACTRPRGPFGLTSVLRYLAPQCAGLLAYAPVPWL
jgi:hypothetical protein